MSNSTDIITTDAFQMQQLSIKELTDQISNLLYLHGFNAWMIEKDIESAILSWFNNLKWPVR